MLCLTPLSCDLMGWSGSNTSSTVVLSCVKLFSHCAILTLTSHKTSSGSCFYIGGVGLYLAGIFEFILGNTFPFIVFCTFGGFCAYRGRRLPHATKPLITDAKTQTHPMDTCNSLSKASPPVLEVLLRPISMLVSPCTSFGGRS